MIPAAFVPLPNTKYVVGGDADQYLYGMMIDAALWEAVQRDPDVPNEVKDGILRVPQSAELEKFYGLFSDFEDPCRSVADAAARWNALHRRIEIAHKRIAELESQLAPAPGPDIVRVLRVVEYVGPRDLVEKQIINSLHGTRDGWGGYRKGASVQITAATVNEFPEILDRARQQKTVPPDPSLVLSGADAKDFIRDMVGDPAQPAPDTTDWHPLRDAGDAKPIRTDEEKRAQHLANYSNLNAAPAPDTDDPGTDTHPDLDKEARNAALAEPKDGYDPAE